MAYVSIIINQAGKDAGAAGVSRSDLSTGSYVTLTNDAPGNEGASTWKWELLGWPKTTANEEAPALLGSTTNTCQFIPTHTGTYTIQLTINNRIFGTICAAIKTTNLIMRMPGEKEGLEFPGGWSFALLDLLRQLETNSGQGGGGGGVGRFLVFSDDTEFTETGSTYSTKKTFRIVIDSDEAPSYWRAVISMWVTGGGGDTALCEVDIGGDIFTMATTSVSEVVLSTTSDLITANSDELLTVTIDVKLSNGGLGDTVHIKYTDIYAVFASGPEV